MAENVNPENLQPPPLDPEPRRSDPLIGLWIAKDLTHGSILGSGVPVTIREQFYWLEGDISWYTRTIRLLVTTSRRGA
jgi:hypothetical protein